jgi:hypothetical protein
VDLRDSKGVRVSSSTRPGHCEGAREGKGQVSCRRRKREKGEDEPVVRNLKRLSDVVPSDGTRALDEDVGVLATLPGRGEEVVEPASEATDGFFHERDGEEVVRDHDWWTTRKYSQHRNE